MDSLRGTDLKIAYAVLKQKLSFNLRYKGAMLWYNVYLHKRVYMASWISSQNLQTAVV